MLSFCGLKTVIMLIKKENITMNVIETKEIIAEAKKIFEAKAKSGAYEHYTDDMLLLLFSDCIKQAETMRAINKR